jgi:hypothetical protein
MTVYASTVLDAALPLEIEISPIKFQSEIKYILQKV